MKYAHFYKSGNYPIVVICDNMQGRGGITTAVTGKPDARKVAQANNAICWNF